MANAAAAITTDLPVKVRLTDETSLSGTLLEGSNGTLRIHAGDIIETAPFPLETVAYINPPPEVTGKGIKLKGSTNLGLTAKQGNTETEQVYVDTEVVARGPTNRFTIGGDTNRQKEAGQEIASSWNAHAKYDHFLSKQWYVVWYWSPRLLPAAVRAQMRWLAQLNVRR